jgi:hypothetical protein
LRRQRSDPPESVVKTPPMDDSYYSGDDGDDETPTFQIVAAPDLVISEGSKYDQQFNQPIQSPGECDHATAVKRILHQHNLSSDSILEMEKQRHKGNRLVAIEEEEGHKCNQLVVLEEEEKEEY